MTDLIPVRVDPIDQDLAVEATALGYYCIAYSRLEYSLGVLIEDLLQCDNQVRRIVVEACGANLKTRTELIRRLSIKFIEDKDIKKALSNVLTYIEHTVQPNRNRLIHDFWPLNQSPETGDMKGQLDDRIFRKRPQSHQPERLTSGKFVPRDAEDIYEQYAKVNATRRLLWAVIISLSEIREKGKHSQRLIPLLRDGHPTDLLRVLSEEPEDPPQSSPE